MRPWNAPVLNLQSVQEGSFSTHGEVQTRREEYPPPPCPSTAKGTENDGLTGSPYPAALLTRAQYKSNNHLTGGTGTLWRRDAVRPNWGFWGNLDFTGQWCLDKAGDCVRHP